MSMGGGGGDTTVKQTTAIQPNPYAEPFINPYIGQGLSVAMQPYQAYPGEQVAPLNPTQQQAFDMTSDIANQSNQQIGNAQNLLNGFATGANNVQVGTNPLMGLNNPYLQQAVNSASQDVVNNYQNATAPQTDSAFARAGAFGGSAWQNAVQQNQHQLTEDLGNIANNAYMGDYNTQAQLQEDNLNRQLSAAQGNNSTQMQAIGAIPGLSQAGLTNASALLGVGNAEQQQQQNQDTAALQQWEQEQGYPYQQLGVMQSVLGSLGLGGNTSSTTAPNPYATNPVAQGIGTGIAGLGLANQLGLLGSSAAGSLGALGAAGGLDSVASWLTPALAVGGGSSIPAGLLGGIALGGSLAA